MLPPSFWIYIQWNAKILSVHLPSFDNWTYLCNPNSYQNIDNPITLESFLSLCFSPSLPSCRDNPCRFLLPVLQLHINGSCDSINVSGFLNGSVSLLNIHREMPQSQNQLKTASKVPLVTKVVEKVYMRIQVRRPAGGEFWGWFAMKWCFLTRSFGKWYEGSNTVYFVRNPF